MSAIAFLLKNDSLPFPMRYASNNNVKQIAFALAFVTITLASHGRNHDTFADAIVEPAVTIM